MPSHRWQEVSVRASPTRRGNHQNSRWAPMTKRVIFSRWRTGLGSTPILWIRFLIFLRRSMNSFGPKARTGG